MNILLLIVYLLSAALLVWFVYWSFKNPDHFLLLDNKYRMMVKIRDCYLKGLKAQPQDSEEYFQRKAAKIIEDYEPVFGPLERKKDIKFQKETVSQMLSRPEYYRFYFTQGQSTLQWFSQMHKDYCSGKYMTLPYDRAGRLIDILPEKLSRNKVLVEGILKLIDAGWLGENVKPMPKIKKQHLALAISILCDHAGVKNYDDFFGSYMGIKPSTMRSNKRHALESKNGGDIQLEIEGLFGIPHTKESD